jgi:ElaB/YqjD/DUF883 family membrane-anchored ribosome-binding protein
METTDVDETLRDDVANVQRAAEDLLSDTGAQVNETAKELTGKAQQLYADVARIVRTSTIERPISALAIAVGVGFIAGALHAATRRPTDYGRD